MRRKNAPFVYRLLLLCWLITVHFTLLLLSFSHSDDCALSAQEWPPSLRCISTFFTVLYLIITIGSFIDKPVLFHSFLICSNIMINVHYGLPCFLCPFFDSYRSTTSCVKIMLQAVISFECLNALAFVGACFKSKSAPLDRH